MPNGKSLVVLGLGPINIRRLEKGEPILVNLRKLDPHGQATRLPDIDVLIAFDDGKLGQAEVAAVVAAMAEGSWP
jgi:hypothetical protein